MLNKEQTRNITRAVNRLIRAEVDAAWKGGKPPDQWPNIEKELVQAREGYKRTITGLTLTPNN